MLINIKVFLKSQFLDKNNYTTDSNKRKRYKSISKHELKYVSIDITQMENTESRVILYIIKDFDIENQPYTLNKGDTIEIFEVDEYNHQNIIFSEIIAETPNTSNSTGIIQITCLGKEFGNRNLTARSWGGKNRKLREDQVFLLGGVNSLKSEINNKEIGILGETINHIKINEGMNISDILHNVSYSSQVFQSIYYDYDEESDEAFIKWVVENTQHSFVDLYLNLDELKEFTKFTISDFNFDLPKSYKYIHHLPKKNGKSITVESDVGYNFSGRKDYVGGLPNGVTIKSLLRNSNKYKEMKQILKSSSTETPAILKIKREIKELMNTFILYKLSRDLRKTMIIEVELSCGNIIDNNKFYDLNNANDYNTLYKLTPSTFRMNNIVELTYEAENISKLKMIIVGVHQIYSSKKRAVLLRLSPFIDCLSIKDDIFVKDIVNKVKNLNEDYTTADIEQEYNLNPIKYKNQLIFKNPKFNIEDDENIVKLFPKEILIDKSKYGINTNITKSNNI